MKEKKQASGKAYRFYAMKMLNAASGVQEKTKK
jgi:hypothetical protein